MKEFQNVYQQIRENSDFNYDIPTFFTLINKKYKHDINRFYKLCKK